MTKNNEYNVGDLKNRSRRPGPPGGRMAVGEKPRDLGASLGRLFRFCRPYIPWILLALCCTLFSTLVSIIAPEKLSAITNHITEGLSSSIEMGAIKRACLDLGILYIVSAVLGLGQSLIMSTVNQKISFRLRELISQKINRLPLKYFDKVSFGDVLSRITNDVDAISRGLNQSIISLITSAFLLFGSLFMMLKTNVLLAATAVAAAFLGFAAMMFLMGRSQKYFRSQQKGLGDINGIIEESYAGHSIVKAYNAGRKLKADFEHLNTELYDSAWRSQFLAGLMMPLMGFVGNLAYVAVCVVGSALVLHGKILFGVIVAFILYVRLFTHPLSQIAQVLTQLQSTAAAGERVFEFLDAEELSKETAPVKLEQVKGLVEFDHVCFGYDPEKPVIKDFSLKVEAGQKVAIVGPTGAGKTTIVNLLMRFYELNGGEIRIDGVPLSALSRENIHDLFGMVLQDTWLFEGSIRENVIYSKEGATEETVQRACKAVGLDHFIHSLPKGYDTILNDRANLSAGQKQLLTIARAMVENAPLIILDEATSSVDTRTETLVQSAMDKLTEGRTSFVIAHRLSTIKNADLILVLRDGDVVESGTHTELLQKNGFYAELYNAQFEAA